MKSTVEYCLVWTENELIGGIFNERPDCFQNQTASLKIQRSSRLGKQSGAARLVATFYDNCNEIWRGLQAI